MTSIALKLLILMRGLPRETLVFHIARTISAQTGDPDEYLHTGRTYDHRGWLVEERFEDPRWEKQIPLAEKVLSMLETLEAA